MDYRLRRRDGEYRWILDHGVPRIDDAGASSVTSGSVIDVTALNTALQTVLESNALRSAIFGSLYGHVAALDSDGVIIAVNHSWRGSPENGRQSGPRPRSAPTISTSAGARPPPATRRLPAGRGLTAVLRASRTTSFEYACRTPDGERWFEMAVEPLRRPEGGAVVTHVDVTRRRQAEEEAERQREELAACAADHHARRAGRLARPRDQSAARRDRGERAGDRPPAGSRPGLGAPGDVPKPCPTSPPTPSAPPQIIQRLRALFRKEHAPRPRSMSTS